KRLHERHRYFAALGEALEDPLCVADPVHGEGHEEPLWWLVAAAGGVAAHQYLIAERQSRVKDAVVPVARHLIGDRRLPMGLHHHDLAAKALLVEFERFLAASVEGQV